MKPIVIYATKSGNSKKVAEAIAEELKCEAYKIIQTNIPPVNLDDYDLLFLGSGINFGSPNEDLVRYLQVAEFKEPKSFAVFLTWGGAGQTDKQTLKILRSLLESKGQTVLADCFKCFGGRQFALLKRGHPNSDDLAAAKEWAQKIVKNKL
jgi:flavodoxin